MYTQSDDLDSGSTRVAARVSGASGERRRLFKSPLHAWPCAAAYGGPAGSHGGCAPRYVHPQGTGVVVVVVNRTIRSHAMGLPTQRRLVLHALVHTRHTPSPSPF